MSFFDPLLDLLFLSSPLQLILLLLVVFVASVVRGAIGFGFSALTVASTSFWLPPVAVVAMTVVLEVVASLIMLKNIRSDIQYSLLVPISIGTVFASLVGVFILANASPETLQIIIASYLTLVCVLSLIKFQFKSFPTTNRLVLVGAIAGLFNGIAAMGGVFIALFLNGSKVTVTDIRATMVIYFLISEVAFFTGALINNVYSTPIFLTSLVATLPMFIGIKLGTQLFHYLPEASLKRLVLYTLIIISILGLIKTLSA